MSRPKKILFGVIVFAAVFTISAFVKNTNVKNTHVNDPIANYLDIQIEIHRRMYILIMDIDSLHQNNPQNIKFLINYVEKLHGEVIISGESNSNRLAKITTSAKDPELLRWMSERLIWVMQPMDDVSNRDDKIVMLIMTMEIEYLYGNIRFLAGDKMEEAMEKTKDFTKKFQK